MWVKEGITACVEEYCNIVQSKLLQYIYIYIAQCQMLKYYVDDMYKNEFPSESWRHTHIQDRHGVPHRHKDRMVKYSKSSNIACYCVLVHHT